MSSETHDNINNTVATTTLVFSVFNSEKLGVDSKVKTLERIKRNLSGHWSYSPTTPSIRDWLVDEESNTDVIDIIDDLIRELYK